MALKLDLLDRKLLYELDIDCRQPLSQLSKKVRASPSVVEYRLKRMERTGLIQNYLTLIDGGKLGLMFWNVYLQLQNTTQKEEEELVSHLSKTRQIWWVAKLSGTWDIVYSLCVKDVKEFYNLVIETHNKFGKYIMNQSLSAHAEIDVVSRGYFLNKPGVAKVWYKDVEPPNLDKTDLKILRTIATNARLSSTEIARRTKLTTRVVAYRINDLKNRGVIHRFRPQFDVKVIGMNYYKVIIYLKDFTIEKNASLKQYCRDEYNIMHYEQKMGPWMLELELDAENYESADKQLKKMKETFPDFIRNYELLLIYDEPKGDLDLTKMIM